MLADASGSKGRSTGSAIFHTLFRDFESKHLTVSSRAFAFENSISMPASLTAAQLAFVESSSKKRGSWRPELAAWLGQLVKRSMDVVLSTVALLLLWPLVLAIAVAIKLESSDPVIYPSLRVGEKGREFICYKFRTMIAGADRLKNSLRRLNERRGPFFKIADDPRVTRLGRFLRKYSLDELPQFWNVLKGEMTLVGPRPHPLDDVELYRPEHFRRLDVKPGLTGLWQVTARAFPSFETCMKLDLAYIEKWSLLLDCRILMKTIPAVLSGEGE